MSLLLSLLEVLAATCGCSVGVLSELGLRNERVRFRDYSPEDQSGFFDINGGNH